MQLHQARKENPQNIENQDRLPSRLSVQTTSPASSNPCPNVDQHP